ncbi:uncharacterized protein [Rutidosis leptorrhynchoides]|uniref:uncharacterized protein n=1 Tax=Rutidosis leptorrhynchoides TaxID=125765 RepID=UPI003A996ECC
MFYFNFFRRKSITIVIRVWFMAFKVGLLLLNNECLIGVVYKKTCRIVYALVAKTVVWENERGVEFTYDGVRLLSMLEDYKILRQQKEEERKRQRDQKKLAFLVCFYHIQLRSIFCFVNFQSKFLHNYRSSKKATILTCRKFGMNHDTSFYFIRLGMQKVRAICFNLQLKSLV